MPVGSSRKGLRVKAQLTQQLTKQGRRAERMSEAGQHSMNAEGSSGAGFSKSELRKFEFCKLYERPLFTFRGRSYVSFSIPRFASYIGKEFS